MNKSTFDPSSDNNQSSTANKTRSNSINHSTAVGEKENPEAHAKSAHAKSAHAKSAHSQPAHSPSAQSNSTFSWATLWWPSLLKFEPQKLAPLQIAKKLGLSKTQIQKLFFPESNEDIIPNDPLQVEALEERQLLSGSADLLEGSSSSFDAQFTVNDPAGQYRILVDQGDGSEAFYFDQITTQTSEDASTVSATIPIYYTDDGQFELRYSLVSGEPGNSGATAQQILQEKTLQANVLDVSPFIEVSSEGNIASTETPFEIEFRAVDPGDDPVDRWVIDWGDGTTEEYDGLLGSALHVYSEEGPYSVQIQAIGEDGHSAITNYDLTASNQEGVGNTGQFGSLSFGRLQYFFHFPGLSRYVLTSTANDPTHFREQVSDPSSQRIVTRHIPWDYEGGNLQDVDIRLIQGAESGFTITPDPEGGWATLDWAVPSEEGDHLVILEIVDRENPLVRDRVSFRMTATSSPRASESLSPSLSPLLGIPWFGSPLSGGESHTVAPSEITAVAGETIRFKIGSTTTLEEGQSLVFGGSIHQNLPSQSNFHPLSLLLNPGQSIQHLEGVFLDTQTGEFVWQVSEEDIGEHFFRFTANIYSDTSSQRHLPFATTTIRVVTKNLPPEITGIPESPIPATEGQPIPVSDIGLSDQDNQNSDQLLTITSAGGQVRLTEEADSSLLHWSIGQSGQDLTKLQVRGPLSQLDQLLKTLQFTGDGSRPEGSYVEIEVNDLGNPHDPAFGITNRRIPIQVTPVDQPPQVRPDQSFLIWHRSSSGKIGQVELASFLHSKSPRFQLIEGPSSSNFHVDPVTGELFLVPGHDLPVDPESLTEIPLQIKVYYDEDGPSSETPAVEGSSEENHRFDLGVVTIKIPSSSGAWPEASDDRFTLQQGNLLSGNLITGQYSIDGEPQEDSTDGADEEGSVGGLRITSIQESDRSGLGSATSHEELPFGRPVRLTTGEILTVFQNGDFTLDTTIADVRTSYYSSYTPPSLTYTVTDAWGRQAEASIYLTVSRGDQNLEATTLPPQTFGLTRSTLAGEILGTIHLTGHLPAHQIGNSNSHSYSYSLSDSAEDGSSSSDLLSALSIDSEGRLVVTGDLSETGIFPEDDSSEAESLELYVHINRGWYQTPLVVPINVRVLESQVRSPDSLQLATTESTPLLGSIFDFLPTEFDRTDVSLMSVLAVDDLVLSESLQQHLSQYDLPDTKTSTLGSTYWINSDGSFHYDPASSQFLQSLSEGETATEQFTLLITDGQGIQHQVELSFLVTGKETPAFVNSRSYKTSTDRSISGNLLTDINRLRLSGDSAESQSSDSLQIINPNTEQAGNPNSEQESDLTNDGSAAISAEPLIIRSHLGGRVTLHADGSFTYDPSGVDTDGLHAGSQLIDRFSYTAAGQDKRLASTASVSITLEVALTQPAAGISAELSVSGDHLFLLHLNQPLSSDARFQQAGGDGGNYLLARYHRTEAQWQYQFGGTWTDFTPESTDRIVGQFDPADSRFQNLAEARGQAFGVSIGYTDMAAEDPSAAEEIEYLTDGRIRLVVGEQEFFLDSNSETDSNTGWQAEHVGQAFLPTLSGRVTVHSDLPADHYLVEIGLIETVSAAEETGGPSSSSSGSSSSDSLAGSGGQGLSGFGGLGGLGGFGGTSGLGGLSLGGLGGGQLFDSGGHGTSQDGSGYTAQAEGELSVVHSFQIPAPTQQAGDSSHDTGWLLFQLDLRDIPEFDTSFGSKTVYYRVSARDSAGEILSRQFYDNQLDHHFPLEESTGWRTQLFDLLQSPDQGPVRLVDVGIYNHPGAIDLETGAVSSDSPTSDPRISGFVHGDFQEDSSGQPVGIDFWFDYEGTTYRHTVPVAASESNDNSDTQSRRFLFDPSLIAPEAFEAASDITIYYSLSGSDPESAGQIDLNYQPLPSARGNIWLHTNTQYLSSGYENSGWNVEGTVSYPSLTTSDPYSAYGGLYGSGLYNSFGSGQSSGSENQQDYPLQAIVEFEYSGPEGNYDGVADEEALAQFASNAEETDRPSFRFQHFIPGTAGSDLGFKYRLKEWSSLHGSYLYSSWSRVHTLPELAGPSIASLELAQEEDQEQRDQEEQTDQDQRDLDQRRRATITGRLTGAPQDPLAVIAAQSEEAGEEEFDWDSIASLRSVKVEYFFTDQEITSADQPDGTVTTDSFGHFQIPVTEAQYGQNQIQARTVVQFLDGSTLRSNTYQLEIHLAEPQLPALTENGLKLAEEEEEREEQPELVDGLWLRTFDPTVTGQLTPPEHHQPSSGWSSGWSTSGWNAGSWNTGSWNTGSWNTGTWGGSTFGTNSLGSTEDIFASPSLPQETPEPSDQDTDSYLYQNVRIELAIEAVGDQELGNEELGNEEPGNEEPGNEESGNDEPSSNPEGSTGIDPEEIIDTVDVADDGSFYYSLDGYFGQVILKARVVYDDPATGRQYRPTEAWIEKRFQIETTAGLPTTVTSLELKDATAGQTDLGLQDPSLQELGLQDLGQEESTDSPSETELPVVAGAAVITGRIEDPNGMIAGVEVEFQSVTTGEILGSVYTDSEGIFEFTASGLEVGTHEVQARAKNWDYLSGSIVAWGWSESLSFEAQQAQPTDVAAFTLHAITGGQADSESARPETSNPMMVGYLLGDGDLSGQTIRIQDGLGGSWDIQTDYSGRFSFTPEEFQPGSYDLTAKLLTVDPENSELILSAGRSLQFTLTPRQDTPPVITDLQVSGTENIPANSFPVVSGVVIAEGRLENAKIEVTISGQTEDGSDIHLTQTVQADAFGYFSHGMADLSSGTYTFSAIATSLAQDDLTQLQSARAEGESSFTYSAAQLPGTPSLQDLYYDTTFGDGVIYGRMEISDENSGSLEDSEVHVLNEDGQIIAIVQPDAQNGRFQYTPAASHLDGDQTLRFRVKRTTETGVIYGEESSLTFTPYSSVSATGIENVWLEDPDQENDDQENDGQPAGITTNPVLSGLLQSLQDRSSSIAAIDPEYMVIEVDVDGDGSSDYRVPLDSETEFTFADLHPETPGLYALGFRIRSTRWDEVDRWFEEDASGEYAQWLRTVDWTTRQQWSDHYRQNSARKWFHFNFVYDTDRSSESARDLARSLESINPNWQYTDLELEGETTEELTLSALLAAAERQEAEDEFQAVGAGQQQAAEQSEAEREYRQQEQESRLAYENAMTEAKTQFLASLSELPEWQRESFHLEDFIWPASPSPDRFVPPAIADLPQSIQSISTYQPKFSIDQDPIYKQTLRSIEKQYKEAVAEANQLFERKKLSYDRELHQAKNAAATQKAERIAEAERVRNEANPQDNQRETEYRRTVDRLTAERAAALNRYLNQRSQNNENSVRSIEKAEQTRDQQIEQALREKNAERDQAREDSYDDEYEHPDTGTRIEDPYAYGWSYYFGNNEEREWWRYEKDDLVDYSQRNSPPEDIEYARRLYEIDKKYAKIFENILNQFSLTTTKAEELRETRNEEAFFTYRKVVFQTDRDLEKLRHEKFHQEAISDQEKSTAYDTAVRNAELQYQKEIKAAELRHAIQLANAEKDRRSGAVPEGQTERLIGIDEARLNRESSIAYARVLSAVKYRNAYETDEYQNSIQLRYAQYLVMMEMANYSLVANPETDDPAQSSVRELKILQANRLAEADRLAHVFHAQAAHDYQVSVLDLNHQRANARAQFDQQNWLTENQKALQRDLDLIEAWARRRTDFAEAEKVRAVEVSQAKQKRDHAIACTNNLLDTATWSPETYARQLAGFVTYHDWHYNGFSGFYSDRNHQLEYAGWTYNLHIFDWYDEIGDGRGLRINNAEARQLLHQHWEDAHAQANYRYQKSLTEAESKETLAKINSIESYRVAVNEAYHDSVTFTEEELESDSSSLQQIAEHERAFQIGLATADAEFEFRKVEIDSQHVFDKTSARIQFDRDMVSHQRQFRLDRQLASGSYKIDRANIFAQAIENWDAPSSKQKAKEHHLRLASYQFNYLTTAHQIDVDRLEASKVYWIQHAGSIADIRLDHLHKIYGAVLSDESALIQPEGAAAGAMVARARSIADQEIAIATLTAEVDYLTNLEKTRLTRHNQLQAANLLLFNTIVRQDANRDRRNLEADKDYHLKIAGFNRDDALDDEEFSQTGQQRSRAEEVKRNQQVTAEFDRVVAIGQVYRDWHKANSQANFQFTRRKTELVTQRQQQEFEAETGRAETLANSMHQFTITRSEADHRQTVAEGELTRQFDRDVALWNRDDTIAKRIAKSDQEAADSNSKYTYDSHQHFDHLTRIAQQYQDSDNPLHQFRLAAAQAKVTSAAGAATILSQFTEDFRALEHRHIRDTENIQYEYRLADSDHIHQWTTENSSQKKTLYQATSLADRDFYIAKRSQKAALQRRAVEIQMATDLAKAAAIRTKEDTAADSGLQFVKETAEATRQRSLLRITAEQLTSVRDEAYQRYQQSLIAAEEIFDISRRVALATQRKNLHTAKSNYVRQTARSEATHSTAISEARKTEAIARAEGFFQDDQRLYGSEYESQVGLSRADKDFDLAVIQLRTGLKQSLNQNSLLSARLTAQAEAQFHLNTAEKQLQLATLDRSEQSLAERKFDAFQLKKLWIENTIQDFASFLEDSISSSHSYRLQVSLNELERDRAAAVDSFTLNQESEQRDHQLGLLQSKNHYNSQTRLAALESSLINKKAEAKKDYKISTAIAHLERDRAIEELLASVDNDRATAVWERTRIIDDLYEVLEENHLQDLKEIQYDLDVELANAKFTLRSEEENAEFKASTDNNLRLLKLDSAQILADKSFAFAEIHSKTRSRRRNILADADQQIANIRAKFDYKLAVEDAEEQFATAQKTQAANLKEEILGHYTVRTRTIDGVISGFLTTDLSLELDQLVQTRFIQVSGSQLSLESDGPDRTVSLGNLRSGLAVPAGSGGTVFVLLSDQPVHSRFSGHPPAEQNADHLILIKSENSQWYYSAGDSWQTFTPEDSDRLIAMIDLDDSVTDMIGGPTRWAQFIAERLATEQRIWTRLTTEHKQKRQERIGLILDFNLNHVEQKRDYELGKLALTSQHQIDSVQFAGNLDQANLNLQIPFGSENSNSGVFETAVTDAVFQLEMDSALATLDAELAAAQASLNSEDMEAYRKMRDLYDELHRLKQRYSEALQTFQKAYKTLFASSNKEAQTNQLKKELEFQRQLTRYQHEFQQLEFGRGEGSRHHVREQIVEIENNIAERLQEITTEEYENFKRNAPGPWTNQYTAQNLEEMAQLGQRLRTLKNEYLENTGEIKDRNEAENSQRKLRKNLREVLRQNYRKFLEIKSRAKSIAEGEDFFSVSSPEGTELPGGIKIPDLEMRGWRDGGMTWSRSSSWIDSLHSHTGWWKFWGSGVWSTQFDERFSWHSRFSYLDGVYFHNTNLAAIEAEALTSGAGNKIPSIAHAAIEEARQRRQNIRNSTPSSFQNEIAQNSDGLANPSSSIVQIKSRKQRELDRQVEKARKEGRQLRGLLFGLDTAVGILKGVFKGIFIDGVWGNIEPFLNVQFAIDASFAAFDLGFEIKVRRYVNIDAPAGMLYTYFYGKKPPLQRMKDAAEQLANKIAEAAPFMRPILEDSVRTHLLIVQGDPISITIYNFLFNRNLDITASNQERLGEFLSQLSPKTVMVLNLMSNLVASIGKELSTWSVEKRAEVISRIVSAVIFDAALSVATAGVLKVVTGARLLQKLDKFGRLADAVNPNGPLGRLARNPSVRNAIAKIGDGIAFILKTRMCFVAGTKVHTKDGLKNIEDIRPGDLVLSQHEDQYQGTMNLEYQPVVQTFQTNPDLLIHLTFSNGESTEKISTTAPHPFYCTGKNKFLAAKDLQEGDEVLLSDGNTSELISIDVEIAQAGERFTTYNFEVSQTHTYFVGRSAIWVHNTGGFDCQELAAKYFDRLHDASKKGDRSKFDELVQKIFKEIDDAHDAGKIGKGTAGKHKQDVLEQLDDLYKRNSLPVGLAPKGRVSGEIVDQLEGPGNRLAEQLRLRRRQLELGYNHEQKQFDFMEGIGGARYEQVVGRRIKSSTIDGSDLIDPRIGPTSLKGPLGINSATGKVFKITDEMIEGLAKSVVKDVQRNTFTKRVVVDLMGLSPSQRASFIKRLKELLGENAAKEIFIVF